MSAATCLEDSLLQGCLCCQPVACGMQQLVVLKSLARRENNGHATASLSGPWVGMREHHWQSSGDKLHSSFGRHPKLPVVERSRMLLALLQLCPVWLLCSGRGLIGKQVPWWMRRPQPSHRPVPFCFLLVVTSKYVEGG